MSRKMTGLALCVMLFALCPQAEGGKAKIYRVGVVLQGGVIYTAVDGLRGGLKELGLEEDNQR